MWSDVLQFEKGGIRRGCFQPLASLAILYVVEEIGNPFLGIRQPENRSDCCRSVSAEPILNCLCYHIGRQIYMANINRGEESFLRNLWVPRAGIHSTHQRVHPKQHYDTKYTSGVAVSKKSVSVGYGYFKVGSGSVTVSTRF